MANTTKVLGKDINIKVQILNYKNKKYLCGFNCGDSEINRYFHYQALDDNNTATYIFIDSDKDIAIALVSISCSKVDYWQDKKYLDSTPAVEIKYFATDEKYHSLPYETCSDKNTLSKSIMSNMVWNIYNDLTKKIGASIIILNSVRKAENFYINCGFQKYETDMDVSYDCINQELIPMYLPLNPDI